jgi:hypothetical protein
MMAVPDLITTFFNELAPEDVPLEYIAAASYTQNGQEVILRGYEELRRLIEYHPDYATVRDARIYINLQKVMKDINLEVDYIQAKVAELFGRK